MSHCITERWRINRWPKPCALDRNETKVQSPRRGVHYRGERQGDNQSHGRLVLCLLLKTNRKNRDSVIRVRDGAKRRWIALQGDPAGVSAANQNRSHGLMRGSCERGLPLCSSLYSTLLMSPCGLHSAGYPASASPGCIALWAGSPPARVQLSGFQHSPPPPASIRQNRAEVWQNRSRTFFLLMYGWG